MPFTPRPTSAQRYQMGPETIVPGVGGLANFRFPTLNFGLVPAGGNAIQTRHAGGKYVGSVIMGDTWSEGPLGGGANQNIIDLNELVFLASGNINNPTPSAAGAAITRVYFSNPDDVDNGLTYKVQRGRTGAVKGFTNVVLPDFGFRFVREGASTVSGRALGKKMAPGATLDTASGLAQQSLASTLTGLYNPTAYAGTLTGRRLDPLGMVLEWHNNGKFAPWFGLDDSIIGPAGFLEGLLDCGGMLTIAFDINDAGTDLRGPFNMGAMEQGMVIPLTVLNTAAVNIPTTSTPYSLRLDLNCQISGPPRETTMNNVEVYEWPYVCVPDATTGQPFRLTSVSAVPIAATTPAV
jgi:hypothetical protein